MATEMVQDDGKENTLVIIKIRNEDYDEDQGKFHIKNEISDDVNLHQICN
jgi:hypothetical protein